MLKQSATLVSVVATVAAALFQSLTDNQMSKIQKTFTYEAPDDYLHQTRTLNKLGVWTYDGPAVIWVFVDKETNRLNGSFRTIEENGDTYPTPLDQIKVRVDCEQNPLLACLVGADEVRDYTLLDQYEETLPDGSVYIRPMIPPPDHTYQMTDIVYNPITGTFNTPYPWKQPHMTWEGIREWRNRLLKMNDHKTLPDMPAALVAQWETYRQQLRDLPQTYGAAPGGTPPIDPWKVQPIIAPDGTT